MVNVQVRLPEDMAAELDALAEDLHASRSEAIRRALDEGLRELKLQRAMQRYQAGDWTLARAAREAGVPLSRFARAAADRGIPFFRYSVEEAEADAQVAAELLRGAPGDD